MKMRSVCLLMAVAAGACGTAAAASPESAVLVSGGPVVMRLNKDEFRIVFGIEAKGCMPRGCNGSVRYRVNWKASDGTTRSEQREVGYSVSPGVARTIAVDRQYLDTAEGAHTVDVLNVRVDTITRRD